MLRKPERKYFNVVFPTTKPLNLSDDSLPYQQHLTTSKTSSRFSMYTVNRRKTRSNPLLRIEIAKPYKIGLRKRLLDLI